MAKKKKSEIKRICTHCNAFGGELVMRSEKLMIHADEEDCLKVYRFRERQVIHESIPIFIDPEGKCKQISEKEVAAVK